MGFANNKFRAKPTVVDGIRFASMKEAKRYGELKLLERAKEIRALELQPRFPLFAIGTIPPEGGQLPHNWTLTKVGHYTADFAYIDSKTGLRVIEDAKSTATATEAYRLRKRFAEAQYGIEIREV